MHRPSSSPSSLPTLALRVLDALPDPPETFTASDVLSVLRAFDGPADDALDAAGILDALARHELVSVSAEAGRYLVHPEARPF